MYHSACASKYSENDANQKHQLELPLDDGHNSDHSEVGFDYERARIKIPDARALKTENVPVCNRMR